MTCSRILRRPPLGIQLLTKVEQRFGLAIEFKQLFVAPTVAQMAQLLAPSERPVAFEQLLSLRTTGSRVPLTVSTAMKPTSSCRSI